MKEIPAGLGTRMTKRIGSATGTEIAGTETKIVATRTGIRTRNAKGTETRDAARIGIAVAKGSAVVTDTRLKEKKAGKKTKNIALNPEALNPN